jgi:hypothetical protein
MNVWDTLQAAGMNPADLTARERIEAAERTSASTALVQTALEVDSAAVEDLTTSRKTEGCEDRTLAAALYALWLNGCHDESGTSTRDGAEIDRIDRYLFTEDEQGFIGYREYADARSAELFLNNLTY